MKRNEPGKYNSDPHHVPFHTTRPSATGWSLHIQMCSILSLYISLTYDYNLLVQALSPVKGWVVDTSFAIVACVEFWIDAIEQLTPTPVARLSWRIWQLVGFLGSRIEPSQVVGARRSAAIYLAMSVQLSRRSKSYKVACVKLRFAHALSRWHSCFSSRSWTLRSV